MADKNKTGDFYTRPEKEGAQSFLWNPETKQFLGRTSGSWGRILLFYAIFYTILALFSAGLFSLFYLTIEDHKPKWTLQESLIKDNPGLGFRPMPPPSNVDSTLIWFRKSANGVRYWQTEIERFRSQMNKYNATSDDGNKKTDCAKSERKFGTVCREKDAIFEKCGDDNYGYQQGKPCVFLKLNKIYDWIPEVYTDAKNLPEKMPEYLKKKIEDIDRKDPKALEQDPTVWVSCEGEYPGDIENLGKTDMEIYSNSDDNKPGFSARFFPYTNQPEYVQPIVAVQFKDIKPGVLVNIECKAWAKNIVHDRAERRGSVHFELLVDDD